MNKDIIKEYGNVLHDPASITERPLQTLSVGPKLDIALGGGVPEGSLFIMTGPEKVGKKRDLQGITGLSLEPEKMQIIGSTEGNILSAEKYLSIIDNIVHTQPGSLAIVDSFSALSSESELTGNLADVQVMSVQKVLAKFCRRISNVLPINRVTVVGITHLMANVNRFGRGKTKVEKSGSALKYQVDVKLHASHSTPLMQGDTQIGQTIHWQIVTSAIGPPGQKVESHIRYGKGIWKEMELADLMIDFGLISKAGAWLKLPNGEKIQGKVNLAKYLEQHPEEYQVFLNEVMSMVGIESNEE